MSTALSTDRRTHARGRGAPIPASPREDEHAVAGKPPSLPKVLPETWKLVKPLRLLLVGCLALMMVNRACGFAIPVASRYLVNDVLYRQEFQRLAVILGGVVLATCVQGVTTFILNQQLSICGQRLIAELRIKVQAHIGRLPIAFFDANRAGALAARVMTDVEGVKNLVGAGMIDLVSGLLAAAIAIVLMLRINTVMTAFAVLVLLLFGSFLKGVFGAISAMCFIGWIIGNPSPAASIHYAGPGVGNPFSAVIDDTHINVGAEYAHYCAKRYIRDRLPLEQIPADTEYLAHRAARLGP